MPVCTRCSKAGIECGGFARRLRYVNETPRIRRSEAVSYAQADEILTITTTSPLMFRSGRVPQSQPLNPTYSLPNWVKLHISIRID